MAGQGGGLHLQPDHRGVELGVAGARSRGIVHTAIVRVQSRDPPFLNRPGAFMRFIDRLEGAMHLMPTVLKEIKGELNKGL